MFKFKKIASILASAVMMGSTIGLAAVSAATYPAPFVSNGMANVAVVYGGNPAVALTDVVEASNIKSDLVDKLLGQRAPSTTTNNKLSVSGEAAPLFTGGSKLYINKTINTVRTTMTKSDLPTILADNTFSGNVDSKYTQTLDLGFNPILTFTKQPTTSDDPSFGYQLTTPYTTNYLYNLTVNFNKETNFTNANSKGQDITLFGQKFTVSSSTDNTNLVLFKEATRIFLDSTGTTSQDVVVSAKKYTVSLVSADSTSATISVTNDAGTTDQRSISEGSSKKIAGLTVAVIDATSSTGSKKDTVSLIAGAEKYTLSTGNSVTYGESDTVIDGTKVTFSGYVGQPFSLGKIAVAVGAKDSDHDAIRPGDSFIDPVFGTLKVDLTGGMNIGMNNTDKRENIIVEAAGTDKIQLDMTDARGNYKSVVFVKNVTSGGPNFLQNGDNGENITVFEKQQSAKNDLIMVGNEDNGRLVKVYQITNQTSGFSSDKVQFQDVFSGETYDTTITAEGIGTVPIGGKTYNVIYYGAQGVANPNVTLAYPDGSGATATTAVAYPTIQTSKGAKIALYKQVNISLDNWDGYAANLTTLKIPNGNGYTSITFTAPYNRGNGDNFVNVTFGSTTTALNLSTANSTGGSVGQLSFNITAAGGATSTSNSTMLQLINPRTLAFVTDPAVILFEEKDDQSNYQALVTTIRGSSGKIGPNDVERTWFKTVTAGTGNFRDTMASDSKKVQQADYFGTVETIDQNNADQYKITISYPDEQEFANLYVAANSAAITGGSGSSTGTGAAGNVLLVVDSEISSVATKNLVVVGGSCINTVAQQLLGSATPLCGADFTTSTGVGAGQYLIQTFDRGNGAVATLVAGYDASDTVNAATALRTQSGIMTSVGSKYTGTTSSNAAPVVTTSTGTSGNSTK